MSNLLIDKISVFINGLQINCFFEKHFEETDKTGSIMNRLHKHSYYEIFFAEEKLEVTTESDKNVYRDSIVIIPPALKHFVSNMNNQSFLFSIEKAHGESNLFLKLNAALNGEKIIFVKGLGETFALSKNVSSAVHAETHFAIEKAQANLVLTFIYILEKLNIFPRENTLQTNDYALQIDNVIHSRFTEKITLKDLAGILNLSPVHTARVVKKIYGTSFSNLINDQRLLVASTLLKNTDKNIAKIIDDLNFTNTNYFFYLFKKKYGITPLQYRKKHNFDYKT